MPEAQLVRVTEQQTAVVRGAVPMADLREFFDRAFGTLGASVASQPDLVGFLGSVRSTQNHAMAPDILKTGKPMCFGGTDPVLTQLGNPWMFRFRPNDSFSARVIAEHGVNGLGKKK